MIDLPMIGRSVISPTLLRKGSTNMSINVASDICRQIKEKTMVIPPVFIVFLFTWENSYQQPRVTTAGGRQVSLMHHQF